MPMPMKKARRKLSEADMRAAAAAFGRLGGKASAERSTPEVRSERARYAVTRRWMKWRAQRKERKKTS
jgi:hypothetical protein